MKYYLKDNQKWDLYGEVLESQEYLVFECPDDFTWNDQVLTGFFDSMGWQYRETEHGMFEIQNNEYCTSWQWLYLDIDNILECCLAGQSCSPQGIKLRFLFFKYLQEQYGVKVLELIKM